MQLDQKHNSAILLIPFNASLISLCYDIYYIIPDMMSLKTEDCGDVCVNSDGLDVCSSSDDRKDLPLPSIHSFTLAATSEREERPTSSTRDVVSLLGKRRPIKIHIGWMHRVGDKYRQVRRKYGGGTREIILNDLNIYSTEIIQRAITLFFPGGASQVLSVEDVESFALGNFCGEELASFCNESGNECTLGEYLKAQGTYASRCYIYLLTRKKTSNEGTKSVRSDSLSRSRRVARSRYTQHRSNFGNRYPLESPMHHDDSTYSQLCDQRYRPTQTDNDQLECATSRLLPADKLGFILEGRAAFEVRYSFAPGSPFASVAGPDTEFTRRECLQFSVFRSPSLDVTDFEPTHHGFVAKRIKINGADFVKYDLDESKKLSFIFPEAVSSEGLILHSPTEVCGYDGEELIIGVIASCHGVGEPYYSWYRNGTVYQEGVNMCCLTVTLPGVYFCQVTFEDTYDISEPLQVVELADCSYKKSKLEPGCVDLNFNCCYIASDSPSRIIPTVDGDSLNVDYSNKVCNGTFGTVYKASWLGTDVHAEFINLNDLGSGKNDFIRNLREINSRIRHPNILSLMACVENKSLISLVSEYHEGATLESLIFSVETRQYLTLDSVLKRNIALQACQGLVYLHALSPPIMHGALHPGSVWVLNQGSVAKLCCPEIRKNSQISDEFRVQEYQSPECLMSSHDVDLPADVWGIGATLTVMLTEERLWGDLSNGWMSVDAVMDQLESGHSPSALQGLRMWKDILTACLNIDPALRPSAVQLLSYLRF